MSWKAVEALKYLCETNGLKFNIKVTSNLIDY